MSRFPLTPWIGFLSFILALIGASAAHADRPRAAELLPESTLVYVRVADVPELREKFGDTSFGQLLQDEEVRPFVGQLYGSLAERFAEVEDEVGVSLGQLLEIPQGEICVALVASEERRPGLVVFIDVKQQIDIADKLLERVQAFLSERGAGGTSELFGDTEIIVHQDANRPNRRLIHFEKEQTLVFATDMEVAKQILQRWTGDKKFEEPPLSKSHKYRTIMSRCRGTRDEPPQFTWLVDPIGLVRSASQGNTSVQIGLSILPTLGLDGLQAVGGSLIYATEEFDTIAHLHLMLDNPRAGVIEMIAFEPGDTKPESWVPDDVFTYSTLNWDVDQTYSKLRTMIDSFRDDGAFDGMVTDRVSNPLGIDFEKEVIDQLDGRLTILSRFEPPARVNSQVYLLAFKVKDPAEFAKTINKVVEKFPERTEEVRFGGVTYHQFDPPRPRRGRRPNREGEDAEAERPATEAAPRPRPPVREPQPCMAIVDDYFMITSSQATLETIIIASTDGTNSLSEQEDYQQIAEELRRQSPSIQPAMISFGRPEQAMQLMFDLVSSEETKQFVDSRAEENRFFRTVGAAMEDNPLPPFDKLLHFFAPTGGMITNDETGFHYASFGLKPEKE